MSEELEKIEISIDHAKKLIARRECLTRLQNNPDWKELIAKGFLESHAVRQVMLKSNPGLQEDKFQKALDNQIIAIGGFQQYLIAIENEGKNAIFALQADEETREELLKEELTNG